MKLRAPAKLNLRLCILGRGEDGFHSIETLFLRLGLADELTIDQNNGGLRLETSGIGDTPTGQTNLCWQVADLFFGAIGRPPAVSIGLVKHIPVAAGLGGGSSDAAAVLLGLNRMHDNPLDSCELMDLAGEAGSDVPFFLSGAPFALGWHRGGRLLPLEPPPSRQVLIAVPDFGVSAMDAYAWYREDLPSVPEPVGAGPGTLPSSVELADWDVLARFAENDLAEPVYRRHPELREATDMLTDNGAVIALLCGSGSCVAGIFQTAAQRDTAAGKLLGNGAFDRDWRLVSTWTCGSGSPDVAG